MDDDRRDELQLERWKAKAIGTIRNECATQLQKLVRLRAAVQVDQHFVDKQGRYRAIRVPRGIVACVTCGVLKPWNDVGLHGGHFMSRRYASTKLDETNVHPQCAACNQHEKPMDRYEIYLRNRYGSHKPDLLRSRAQLTSVYVGDTKHSCARFIRQCRDEINRLKKVLEVD